ncbi:Rab2 [Tritrichomonas foetus]|uniref:Rab2 n=1 Tax=Tritrichomonas foetus TaxID=1144522 RepID=A0A1J4KFJ3_9EUKA|nr:Rab2 [Tritrichomonas foetus]|eukprot:OHT10191.1 Rab2 [Tritrichomonas foetus]
MAGNKSDLIEKKKILPAEVKKWASEKKKKYVETSAKTGEGVKKKIDELMTTLVHANAKKKQKKPLSLEAREKGKKNCC